MYPNPLQTEVSTSKVFSGNEGEDVESTRTGRET